jgi:hypothetical protein
MIPEMLLALTVTNVAMKMKDYQTETNPHMCYSNYSEIQYPRYSNTTEIVQYIDSYRITNIAQEIFQEFVDLTTDEQIAFDLMLKSKSKKVLQSVI